MKRKQDSNQSYTFSQFSAFAGDDPESLHQIIAAFVCSGLKNAGLLRQSIRDQDRESVSELAHKMLPLFRQIQANEIVSILSQLEQMDLENATVEIYFLMGQMALEKIEEILENLQKKEKIDIR